MGFIGGMPLNLKDLPVAPTLFNTVAADFAQGFATPQPVPPSYGYGDSLQSGEHGGVEVADRAAARFTSAGASPTDQPDEAIVTTARALLPKRPVPPPPVRRARAMRRGLTDLSGTLRPAKAF